MARTRSRAAALATLPQGGPPMTGRTVGGKRPRRRGREKTTGAHVVQSHPMVEASMEDLVSYLLSAETGFMAPAQDLYDDMLERDVQLSTVYGKRTEAIAEYDFLLEPPKGFEQDPRAKEAVALCTDALWGIDQVVDALVSINEARARGYSLHEIVWGTDARGRVMPRELAWVHPNRVALDPEFEPRVYDLMAGETFPGRTLEEAKGGPDGFVWHCPTHRSMYPTRRGLMRSATWMVLIKRYGLRWWTVGLERYGLPGLYAVLGAGQEHLEDAALEFLEQIAADWQAVTTQNFTVRQLEGTNEFKGDAHELIVRLADEQNTKLFLGQTLTTDTPTKGGSRAQGEVHERAEARLVRGDARQLWGTIRRDLFEPVVRYNLPGAPIPVARSIIPDPERELPAHYVAAAVFTRNEIRASQNAPPREGPDGEELIGGTAAFPPGAPSVGGNGELDAGGSSDVRPFSERSTRASTLSRSSTRTSPTSPTPRPLPKGLEKLLSVSVDPGRSSPDS